MSTKTTWTKKERDLLMQDFQNRLPGTRTNRFCKAWGERYGRSTQSVNAQIVRMIDSGLLSKEIIKESPYPTYDEPLVSEGDAVVLPDVEFPFHNSDFLNRVLDLCQRWNIKKCIFAGDVLHFDSLSGWEPNWVPTDKGGMTSDAERVLMEFAKTLPSKRQGEMMNLIVDIGEKKEQDGVSTELNVARKALRNIEELFDSCDFVIGNHEGRLLRALKTTLDPEELLRLVDIKNKKWRIAPYYFSYLDTSNGRFMIEHPKGAAESTAQRLAAKFGMHVIMAHSHALDFTWDISGKYYAIQAGCCVDEMKLPYAAQRHTTKRMHKLGAVIVREGYPFLLHDKTPWKLMSKM